MQASISEIGEINKCFLERLKQLKADVSEITGVVFDHNHPHLPVSVDLLMTVDWWSVYTCKRKKKRKEKDDCDWNGFD